MSRYKPTQYRGVYTDGKKFVERVRVDGKDTFKRIAESTAKKAYEYRIGRLLQHNQAKDGFAVSSPYAKAKTKSASVKVAELCEHYIECGMPRKDKSLPEGEQAAEEKRRVELLKSWNGWGNVYEITAGTLDRYETWRRKESKRMKGGRSLDLEIRYTLKNVFRFALRSEKISSNPLQAIEMGRFQRGKATPCRDCRAQSAEELHMLARELFTQTDAPEDSQNGKGMKRGAIPLGFQFLLEAFTGIRTSEALALRWDAKYGEAGYIDGEYLHLARKKSGVNPWAKIHPALSELLAVMKRWNLARKNPSKYFIPGKIDGKPAEKTSLSHTLNRLVAKLIKEEKLSKGARRTSHGARAYYVGVRRSEFVADGMIALELGDVSGPSIIEKHYGPLPPNWRDSKEGKLTWLPLNGKPAWAELASKLPDNVIALKVA
jgi:integrase